MKSRVKEQRINVKAKKASPAAAARDKKKAKGKKTTQKLWEIITAGKLPRHDQHQQQTTRRDTLFIKANNKKNTAAATTPQDQISLCHFLLNFCSFFFKEREFGAILAASQSSARPPSCCLR
jgi:hypothetical protein